MAIQMRTRMMLLGAVVAAVTLPASAQSSSSGGQQRQLTARPSLDETMQRERLDLGVQPTRQLHAGPMHGATPSSIPGGQLITTKGLVALLNGNQAPTVLIDVLGQAETLPNAIPAAWMAQPGSFDDQTQQQLIQQLQQRTGGRKDFALVFYCLSRECWMSYNAALRAINAGYTNVLWYRGGIEAWKMAGFPTHGDPGHAQQQGMDQPPAGQHPPANLPPPQAAAAQAQFVPVRPVVREAAGGGRAAPPAGELRIGQGRFFSFVMPPGWRVGEDGQFALTLLAPDNNAMTLMVGNAGLPPNHSPARFAYDKLSALRPQRLQLGQPRQSGPVAGFARAWEFDVSYVVRGIPHHGVAKVSVAPAYDSATMAMTAALAAADQWVGYSRWLPQVADHISATNGAAFGMRGIMQQNLQNSTALANASRQYRDWSQKNWQQVTDARNASQDRRNFAVRENLGGVQTFANPYATSQPVEMPMTHKYYWADRQGRMVGTDDPSANPNTGSTGDWRKMERVGQ